MSATARQSPSNKVMVVLVVGTIPVGSDSLTLGKSNLSDIENSKMTYVSEFGLAESEKRADDLSVWCAEKINTAFDQSKAKDLKDLAHFMVTRSN